MNVTLKHSGDIITVDEDDLEKANPPEQDLVEDLCSLKHLNEASVLHCIRQRFGNNLIHTKAGNVLIVVNPTQPLSLYSEKVCELISLELAAEVLKFQNFKGRFNVSWM